MGYRSQVALAMKNETFKEMLQNMDDEAAPDLLTNVQKSFAAGWILLRWDWVKWYSDYAEVAAVEAFMHNLDSSDRDAEYAFVRAGEEWDDTEERGNCGCAPFYLGVQKTVSLDWNEPADMSNSPPADF